MTTKDIILSIFELLLFGGMVAGFIFENKLIVFEDRIKEKLKKWR